MPTPSYQQCYVPLVTQRCPAMGWVRYGNRLSDRAARCERWNTPISSQKTRRRLVRTVLMRSTAHRDRSARYLAHGQRHDSLHQTQMLRENLSHPTILTRLASATTRNSSEFVVRIRASHIGADVPRSASGMVRPRSRADERGCPPAELGARRNPKIRHSRIGTDKASQDSPSQMPSPNKAKARPALERTPTNSGVRNTCQAVR
jgi:hypothetical protein